MTNSASTPSAKYGGEAVFLSSGGYHHHIGANSWRSPGAGRRDPSRSGLSWVEMQSKTAKASSEKTDPWGTVIREVPVALGRSGQARAEFLRRPPLSCRTSPPQVGRLAGRLVLRQSSNVAS